MSLADTLASPTLDVIAAAYSAVVIERQMLFEQLVPDTGWSADLGACELTIGERTLTVSLLGSESDDGQSWLWSWANPAFGPEHPCTRPVEPLRELGTRYDIGALRDDEVHLPAVHASRLGPAHTLAVVACGVLGARAYYPATYDGGTAFLMITDSSIPLPDPDPAGVSQLMFTALNAFGQQPELTVLTYLGVHQLPASRTGTGLIAHFGDQDVEFTFGAAGQLQDVAVRTAG